MTPLENTAQTHYCALLCRRREQMGKGGMDLHNMDASTVAQMMHKMNPQMLAHLGGQQGLEQMMQEMEKEEKSASRQTSNCPSF